MSKGKKLPQYSAEYITGYTPKDDYYTIKKSLETEQLDKDEEFSASIWRTKLYNQYGLSALVDDSTILPQCINAYGNNIAGFGISLTYNEDYKDETPEMKAEWDRVKKVLDLMSAEKPLKSIFVDLIKDRETIGIGYIEIIRNELGEVVQIEHITYPHTVEMTVPLAPLQDYIYTYKGEEIVRKKKFKKYRQTVGAKTIYFKEFGDPRIMNKRTGEYVNGGLPVGDEANEILEFKVGTMPYGKVRWLGQTLSVDGARRAEILNNNYFRKGRHTPLMIIIRGGSLTSDSKDKLRRYMDDIEGESGQHGYLVLEAENTDNPVAASFGEEQKKPEIEIKDLAAILQKDELFQEYGINARKKVQSSFLLPDLYVGYSTDYNRATAQTAMEVTEKQVFQPERQDLAWIINNKLLNSYGFKYVDVQFESPDMTNPDDIAKIISVTANSGGLTLNDSRDLTAKTLGKEAEPYPDNIGNLPLALINTQISDQELSNSIEKSIEKAKVNNDDDIIDVLRSIKKAIIER
ncbi:MAG: phage portal protein [Clostridia bacterium]|nr:phage portal protein [Clostridia bacterium]